MATDFTQEAVLDFLRSNGGIVRNANLLGHFNEFLREHEERTQNRELFKTFVNSLATVKQEDGVCYVVLKKKFRPILGDVSASKTSSNSRPEKKYEDGKHRVRDKPAPTRKQEQGEAPSQASNQKTQKTSNTPACGALHSTEHILSVAGIVNNNKNNGVKTVHLEKPVQSSSPHAWEQTVSSVSSNESVGDTSTLKPAPFITDSKRSSGSGQSADPSGELKVLTETADPKHNSFHNAELGQLREPDGCSQTSFWPPLDFSYREVVVTPPLSDTASKNTLNDYHEEPWPFPIPLAQSQSYASSPCLADLRAASSSLPYIQGGLSRSNDSLLRPIPGAYIQEPEEYGMASSTLVSPAPQRRRLPLETLHPPGAAGQRGPGQLRGLGQFRGISSSQSDLTLFSAADPDWPPQLTLDDWSSEDALDVIMAEEVEQDPPIRRRLREAELLAQLHRPERSVAPWHRSTGDLLEQEAQLSLPGRVAPAGPVARRLSQRLRSRLCRSLGADLDQTAREDGESARLRRLRRISSFLSDRPASASSSRAHSTLDGLSSAGSTPSLDSASLGPRHPQVPVEPREHEWFAKAAAGTWADVYSLFREEPGLLARRDFVSGYTVLHWIAKRGDHRVLNTLWYGVSKTDLRLDVDARSTCGYTPLHLAALHCHKKMLRLLVHKFRADVAIRDNSGKKAWQYLEKTADRELFELLGAPRRAVRGNVGERWAAKKPPTLAAVPSAATVKRHSSLAMLFKHKPQLRIAASAESFL